MRPVIHTPNSLCCLQFINLVSGSRQRVGTTLDSATSVLELSKEFHLDGQRVALIETPGFDDSSGSISHADVLTTIADFLSSE